MEIVLEWGEEQQQEVDLLLEDPAASVGDLVDALGVGVDAPGHEPGIEVEGRFFPPDYGLDEVNLHVGAHVRVGVGRAVTPERRRGPVLRVVDGPSAGHALWLHGQPAVVGRDPDADLVLTDPTLSGLHAQFEPGERGTWTVTDLGSSNGTWVDGRPATTPLTVPETAMVRLGATHLRLTEELPDDRPVGVDPLHGAQGGLVPFNRPPRGRLPDATPAVELPERPDTSKKSRALSIVSIIAPIILGTALVIIYQNPRFALFLLLSPVIAVGNWLSGRRQAKKENRANTRAFRESLSRLERDLAGTVEQERRRREQLLPDLFEVSRRIRTPSTRLWERRPGDEDLLLLRAGVGDVPWDPPVDAPRAGPAEEVAEVVSRFSVLRDTPVEVDLSDGGVVGLVGERSAALRLARSLIVQACAHHGPADLGAAIVTSDGSVGDWDWAKWLPHLRDATGSARQLAAGHGQAEQLLEALLAAAPTKERAPGGLGVREAPVGRTLLFVLDDVSLARGRRSPARLVLRGEAGPVAGIVIAGTEDQLPAVTGTVVHCRSELGDADLRRPQLDQRIDDLVIGGLDEPLARELARTLARYEDPELALVGAGLPRGVRLLPVLGLEEVDGAGLVSVWSSGPVDRGVVVPVGVGESGVVEVDLVAEGPHGLVGGTTGSGKSELLRSLVAGAAARVGPEHLVFVLVDYKGGSAFDRCAQLPHTVGLVTDLDEHLGQRALTSLQAELSFRERVLRRVGCQDLPAYLAAGSPAGPMPRLVVVIDEFATLAAELPDFLGALVGVAQRGRSLGVHLILATQRPSGAVNANIKANTNLRVALRVQDAADSVDIIDRKDAAEISRETPGRAYVRRGAGDVVVVQTPLSTGCAPVGGSGGVRVVPFVFGPRPVGLDEVGAGSGASDLDRLVDAANEAFVAGGYARPRRPWLEMLAERIGLDELSDPDELSELPRPHDPDDTNRDAGPDAADEGTPSDDAPSGVPIGLADEPERQRRAVLRWGPTTGHLGLFGMVGSGTTTALRTLAQSLTDHRPPEQLHLYALDFGAGGLADLEELPHVGAVVPATAAELRERLLRRLRRELDRRRDLGPRELDDQPHIVVLVDGVGSLLAEFDGTDGLELGEIFRRVFADGPRVGIVFVVAATRLGDLPTRLSALVPAKLVLRHADPQELAGVGLRVKSLPTFVPGRAVDVETQRVVQLALPRPHPEHVAALRERWPEADGPGRLRALPATVAFADVAATASVEGGVVRLPVGLEGEELQPAVLELPAGGHALVAGPPRSGKTSALVQMAHLVREADPTAVVLALCPTHSPLYGIDPLDGAGHLADLKGVVKGALTDGRRWVLLVDDAPRVVDVEGVLAKVLGSQRPGLHLVAAGRIDDLRAGLTHWTRPVRQSRTGLLLQPNLAADGEVLQTRLPRRVASPLGSPGRGFVVNDGVPTLAQLRLPPG
jgi:DNA segregation ATPase FtsK/SpoIIIE, S-DNA-T family